MSKITIEGIEELLGLKPPPPPKGMPNATPPLIAPQSQNPMPSPMQTGAPSVANRPLLPPTGTPPPPPKQSSTTQATQSNPTTGAGLLVPGNIDIHHRPIVHNPDGSISTVRSITITDDNGRAILIPTVVNGRVVSNQEAIKYYQQTGQQLGIFANEQAANQYAQSLHEQQSREYLPAQGSLPPNPLNQALSQTQAPGTTQTAVVPPAVAERQRHNANIDAKRREGTQLRQEAQSAGPTPGVPVAPPPPTTAGGPVQYHAPNKTLDYIGAALAMLFGGSRAGAAGAGLVQGLGQHSQDQYARDLQQREAEIAASQQGYDLNTGKPIISPQLFTPKQEYTPPNATPQQLEQHYLRLADIAAQFAANHPGPEGEQAAKVSQTYKGLADSAAQGYERFAQGTYTAGAKTAETEARANHWKTWNQTYLSAIQGREKTAMDEMARRFYYSTQLRGMINANERQAIAERAAYYAKSMNAREAFQKAMAEGNQEAAALREQAALQAAGTPEQVGVPGITINVNGEPTTGATTPTTTPSGLPADARVSPDGKQYWSGGHIYDMATHHVVQ